MGRHDPDYFKVLETHIHLVDLKYCIKYMASTRRIAWQDPYAQTRPTIVYTGDEQQQARQQQQRQRRRQQARQMYSTPFKRGPPQQPNIYSDMPPVRSKRPLPLTPPQQIRLKQEYHKQEGLYSTIDSPRINEYDKIIKQYKRVKNFDALKNHC
jgi:hypothetical protein